MSFKERAIAALACFLAALGFIASAPRFVLDEKWAGMSLGSPWHWLAFAMDIFSAALFLWMAYHFAWRRWR